MEECFIRHKSDRRADIVAKQDRIQSLGLRVRITPFPTSDA